MVDVGALAASAVGMLVSLLRPVVDKVIERTQLQAAESVSAVVRDRLARVAGGGELLHTLEASPTNRDAQSAVRDALQREMEGDQQLTQTVLRLVQAANTQSASAGGHQTGVAVGGNVIVRDGVIGGPGSIISQNRTTKISTGGWIVLVVLALLGVGGTTTAVVLGTQPDTPREVVEEYYKALGDKDVQRIKDLFCRAKHPLLTDQRVRELGRGVGTPDVSTGDGETVGIYQTWEIGEEKIHGRTSTVDIILTVTSKGTDASGKYVESEEVPVNLRFTLVDEDGWKICDATNVEAQSAAVAQASLPSQRSSRLLIVCDPLGLVNI